MTIVATLKSYPTTSATATVNHVTSPVTGAAQGVYFDSGELGQYAIILPNGSHYGVMGQNDVNVNGSMQGLWSVNYGTTLSDSNGNYAASLTVLNWARTYSERFSGTYVPGVSLVGTFGDAANPHPSTFTGTAPPSTQYDYNAPAVLPDIAGTWTSWFIDDPMVGWQPNTLTISSTGEFSGGYGCPFSGTMKPDASNKNFFNVTVTATAPCWPQPGTGVAIYMLLPNGTTHQLLVAADNGFALAAQR